MDDEVSDEANARINAMLPQLLMALIKRNGGKLDVPIAEVDDTGGDLLAFMVDPDRNMFHFEVRKKQ